MKAHYSFTIVSTVTDATLAQALLLARISACAFRHQTHFFSSLNLQYNVLMRYAYNFDSIERVLMRLYHLVYFFRDLVVILLCYISVSVSKLHSLIFQSLVSASLTHSMKAKITTCASTHLLYLFDIIFSLLFYSHTTALVTFF